MNALGWSYLYYSKYGSNGWYSLPFKSLPYIFSITFITFLRSLFLPDKNTNGNLSSATIYYSYGLSSWLTIQYVISSLTHKAKFDGNVHGVVVHAKKYLVTFSIGYSTHLNFITTHGSTTSL